MLFLDQRHSRKLTHSSTVTSVTIPSQCKIIISDGERICWGKKISMDAVGENSMEIAVHVKA